MGGDRKAHSKETRDPAPLETIEEDEVSLVDIKILEGRSLDSLTVVRTPSPNRTDPYSEPQGLLKQTTLDGT